MITIRKSKLLGCILVAVICFSACSSSNKESVQNTNNTPASVENNDTHNSTPVSVENNDTQKNELLEFEKEYQGRCYQNYYAFPYELDMLVESKQPLTKFCAKIVKCTQSGPVCIFTIDRVETGEDNAKNELSLEERPLYTNKEEKLEELKVPFETLVFLSDFTPCNSMDFCNNFTNETCQNVTEEDGTTSAIYNVYSYGDTVLLMFSIYIP